MFPVWRPSPGSWKVLLSLHFVTLTMLLIARAPYCRSARAVVVSSVVPQAVLSAPPECTAPCCRAFSCLGVPSCRVSSRHVIPRFPGSSSDPPRTDYEGSRPTAGEQCVDDLDWEGSLRVDAEDLGDSLLCHVAYLVLCTFVTGHRTLTALHCHMTELRQCS